MTTTIVRDSIVGDDWIRKTAAAVPVQRILGEDGQPTGDILTGPVRLAFCNLFTLPQASEDNQNPKFGAALLFTPLADFSILYDEFYRICALKFADRYDPSTQSYMNVHSPFRNQAEKLKFGGFTSGCTFITATSKYKPPVIDPRYNPIIDPSKAYPGVWAICSVNAYSYHDKKKQGVAFGMQSCMIIGDDTQHGGGPKDVKQQFAKVNIAAPIVRPDIAGMMPQGANPPVGMPPRPGGAPQQIPQTAWAPPPPPPASDDDDMSWNQ